MSTLETKVDAPTRTSTEDHSGHPGYDDVNVPFVVLLGVVSAIVTYVSIVGVQGLYLHWEADQIRIKVDGATLIAAEEIEKQRESLDDFYVAKSGAVKESIPIGLAMTMTVSEFKKESAGKQGPKEHDQATGNKQATGDQHADEHAKDADSEKESQDKKVSSNAGESPKMNNANGDDDGKAKPAEKAKKKEETKAAKKAETKQKAGEASPEQDAKSGEKKAKKEVDADKGSDSKE